MPALGSPSCHYGAATQLRLGFCSSQDQRSRDASIVASIWTRAERESRDLKRRAGRKRRRQALAIDLIDDVELGKIEQIEAHCHRVGEGESRFVQHGFQIVEHGSRLTARLGIDKLSRR